MKRIFWGVMGEGLGHVTRALAVIEHLPDCEVHLFTHGQALGFLQRSGYAHLHAIDGLMFRYRRGRVAQGASLRGALMYFLRERRRNVRIILRACERLQPDLFVTDFEPSLPCVAQVWGGPLLSIDNQHRFSHCVASDLPFGLRCYARLVGAYIHGMLGRPQRTLVATFYPEYLTPRGPDVEVVPAIIRPALEQLPVRDEGFVLAYLRESIRERLLPCLRQLPRPCLAYGAPASESGGSVECRPISSNFVEDLARCSCVVATAGHQLISEACFLGKPILAIPEPGQFEQSVNAFYAQRIGAGQCCALSRITPAMIRAFCEGSAPRARRLDSGASLVARRIRQYGSRAAPDGVPQHLTEVSV
jgi:uncharacterized protein (TIGR00661 family)